MGGGTAFALPGGGLVGGGEAGSCQRGRVSIWSLKGISDGGGMRAGRGCARMGTGSKGGSVRERGAVREGVGGSEQGTGFDQTWRVQGERAGLRLASLTPQHPQEGPPYPPPPPRLRL